ncbi:S10 family peptidase [Oleiagrimonas citrea]|uniref:Peptidase S10 n=1 Tax=Oleiagrimonas citrea TaxID=1665687 RepID=A0A846ZCR3_9GAMM|nr:peptidase S10 [Oleiagrimonas citrea]NKZ37415.1 peptidase S10 [Oleiagrimonas citrea]
MRTRSFAFALLTALLFALLSTPSLAADAAKKKDGDMQLPPFPADAHTTQVTHVAGKTVKYTVTVGSLPIRNDKGKKIAEVMYTAYVVPGKNRPVTFAFNGGPGASSVYLNFGAIGPKKIRFGDEGDNPSDAPTLHDNPGTWLDFTDLVFIDPVGTGFSRSLESQKQTVKDFYSTDADIHYLSRIVYDWLIKNGRMTSRKYLVGESYGGFRGPRITEYLQTQLGVAMNGVVLVSPYLDPNSYKNGEVSPLPWMLTLPSITAAHLEREGKLTPQAMQKVIAYTRGEYAHTLMLGHTDPAARERMIQRVTQMTGLDPTFVKRSGGRLDTGAYLREVHRSQGKLGSVYDSNLTGWDPFPYAPEQESNDPMLNAIIAPTTEAMVNFITRTVGWKYDGRYYALSYKVNRLWHKDDDADSGSVKQLREAVANDGKLRVLIAHGWNDLSCPFMGSILVVDQMPKMGSAKRVQVREYPGGHMFYTRPDSQKAFRKDVKALFEAR